MVIHDKMNYAKTTSLCFVNRIKATDGFFKLHVSVTSEDENNVITYPKRMCHSWGTTFGTKDLRTMSQWISTFIMIYYYLISKI